MMHPYPSRDDCMILSRDIESDQKNGKYLICGTPQLRKSNNFVAQLKSKRLRVK